MLIAVLTTVLMSAAGAARTPSAQEPSIVVTGRTIQDKKAGLAACLARNCPPDQDIDATLALAETQLVAGKYHDARRDASRFP